MKRYIYTGIQAALLIGWGCMMACCSSSGDDGGQPGDYPEGPLEGELLRVGSVTRSGDEDPQNLDPNPLPWGNIKLYMIPAEGDYPKTPTSGNTGVIAYNGLGDDGYIIWDTSQLRLVVKPGRDYYMFGYMPADLGMNATFIAPENGGPGWDTDGDGIMDVPEPTVQQTSTTSATMTFTDLPTVTNEDFCIIVGAKEGKTPLGIADQGSFIYHAPENTSNGYYVSLLADHLYASVEFRVTVDHDYNVLRKVKLTKMTLKSSATGKTLLDTQVTLTMNDQGTHPIATNPVNTLKSGGSDEFDLYNNTDGVELSPTVAQSFTGCFAEGLGEDLSIECQYDIYDRVSGALNKIETRTVVNGLKSLLQNLRRGRKKVINMKVDPTYLYQLSDGDVDK